jgi:C-terminal processing protease CtpA/Prc
MVRTVAARFFEKDRKVAMGRSLTRTGKPVTLAFDWIEVIKLRQELEGTGTYAGPVAVLVNAGSGSGSELFAGLLQAHGRARVVGETSCGCLLAFLGYATVPGGGRLAYSEVGFEFPNGARIEGAGVVPDVPVPTTAADLLADRDRALEAAVASLLMKGEGSAPRPR